MKTQYVWATDYSEYLFENVATAVRSALAVDSGAQCHIYVYGAETPEGFAFQAKWRNILETYPDSVYFHYQLRTPPHPHFIRAEAVSNFLTKTTEPFWFLDGDVIVRKKLPSRVHANLGMRIRPFSVASGPYMSRLAGWLNAGVVYVSPVPEVRKFWSDVRGMHKDIIEDLGPYASYAFVDQETYALVALRDCGVRIEPLDDFVNDSYFRRGASIWHFKGNARGKFRYRVLNRSASISSYWLWKWISDLVSLPFWIRDYFARASYACVLRVRLNRAIRRSGTAASNDIAITAGGCLWNARLRAQDGAHAMRTHPVEVNPERHAHSGWSDGVLAGCPECVLDAKYAPEGRSAALVGNTGLPLVLERYLCTVDMTWRDIRMFRFFWLPRRLR